LHYVASPTVRRSDFIPEKGNKNYVYYQEGSVPEHGLPTMVGQKPYLQVYKCDKRGQYNQQPCNADKQKPNECLFASLSKKVEYEGV
jgi:hypothetical protein